MQVATSPSMRLPCSVSESSSFDILHLPASSSGIRSFNTTSFQSTSIRSPRLSRNITTVTSPCVDVIHLTDSPVLSTFSTSPSASAASPSSPSLRQFEEEFKVSDVLRVAAKNLEFKKRRAVFTVVPDDDGPSRYDSSEVIGSESGAAIAQEFIRTSREGQTSKVNNSRSSQASEPGVLSTDQPDSSLQDLKQWHALTEIVSTEFSYVYDLRKLVNVYFPALSALPLESSTSIAIQQLEENVTELLNFHEPFLKALQSAKKHGSSVESLDDAIERIARLFISRASHFDLYKQFCSSQPEVHTLLGTERSRLKAEWRIFEQQCAAEGSSRHRSPERTVDLGSTDGNSGCEMVPLTASSAESSGASSLKWRIPSSSTFAFLKVSTSSRTISDMGRSGIQRSFSVDSISMPGRRLRFHDFLITPVQRICRYPILLEGLRQSKAYSEHIDTALVQAVQSMHAVTTRVNEARRVWEETNKTTMILNRIESHSIISHEFLRSLGNCLLAGPLDIAHHHHVHNPIDPPVRVQYMAAFLFSGGYLFFAKVSKNRTYRMKHWFKVSSFEIFDISEEDALVPHAFRLSRQDYHFEIAAACTSEKELWLQTIKNVVQTGGTCLSEPLSSLDIMEEFSSAVSTTHLQDDPQPAQLSPSKETFSLMRDDQQRIHAVTRPSVRVRTMAPGATKLFSVSDGSPLLLKRSTLGDRELVDREMKDVQTSSITDCRLQAQTRNETMFPPPKFAQPVQVMAMATTNKLVRRGSWLLNRSRNQCPSDTQEENTPVSPSRRANRVGPSVAPSLSALYSEPECIDTVEKPPSSNGHEQTFAGSDLTHDGMDEGIISGSSKKSMRRKNSLAAGLKELVRRTTLKRNCEDKASSRRRVSSAPPSPPLTQSGHQEKNCPTKSDNTVANESFETTNSNSTSPLRARSSLKRMIFRA
ncbi:hypothetical protein Clacol_001292 [Clathrus columnatus]|uniref:DH domain-containing protein n=1 Tax=Clathrus columnatus TaxID=1419009 RepID=A0AAV5A387_9AGAM|nr:hypothetical protein Clacol_001292 [Clathrus columnatus]